MAVQDDAAGAAGCMEGGIKLQSLANYQPGSGSGDALDFGEAAKVMAMVSSCERPAESNGRKPWKAAPLQTSQSLGPDHSACVVQGGIVKNIKMQGLCLYLRPAGSCEVAGASAVEGGTEVADAEMLLQPLDGVARLSLDTGKPLFTIPCRRRSCRRRCVSGSGAKYQAGDGVWKQQTSDVRQRAQTSRTACQE